MMFISLFIFFLNVPAFQATTLYSDLPLDARKYILFGQGLGYRERAAFAQAGKQFNDLEEFRLSTRANEVVKMISKNCLAIEEKEDTSILEQLKAGRVFLDLTQPRDCLEALVNNIELFTPLKRFHVTAANVQSRRPHVVSSNKLVEYLRVLHKKFTSYPDLVEQLRVFSVSGAVQRLDSAAQWIPELVHLFSLIPKLDQAPHGMYSAVENIGSKDLLQEYLALMLKKRSTATIFLDDDSDDLAWLFSETSMTRLDEVTDLSKVVLSLQERNENSIDLSTRIIPAICNLQRNISLRYAPHHSLFFTYEPLLQCPSVSDLEIVLNAHNGPTTLFHSIQRRQTAFKSIDITFKASPIHCVVMLGAIADHMSRFGKTESLILRDFSMLIATYASNNKYLTMTSLESLKNLEIHVQDFVRCGAVEYKQRIAPMFAELFRNAMKRKSTLTFTIRVGARRCDEFVDAISYSVFKTLEFRGKLPVVMNLEIEKDGFEHFVRLSEYKVLQKDWNLVFHSASITLSE